MKNWLREWGKSLGKLSSRVLPMSIWLRASERRSSIVVIKSEDMGNELS
jgi:hypothetical protein